VSILKWVAYGIAFLLFSGLLSVLVGRVIEFSQPADDQLVPGEYGMAKAKNPDRQRQKMRLKRLRIGRMRVGA